jgi:hypothetical protein
MNDKKYYYTVSWSQPYSLRIDAVKELEDIRASLIEKVIDDNDLLEANIMIKRIMKL